MATTNDAMVWTCRLALAVAEADEPEINAVVAEAMADPGGASMLLTTLAGTVASLMGEQAGSNWREGIRQTIVELRRGS